jgi:hypothetical protein
MAEVSGCRVDHGSLCRGRFLRNRHCLVELGMSVGDQESHYPNLSSAESLQTVAPGMPQQATGDMVLGCGADDRGITA